MSPLSVPQFFWDSDVAPQAAAKRYWIWHGLFGRGVTTLLTGHGKLTGKTTLLSLLLSRRVGGGLLANLGVTAGKTVVISEEDRSLWDDRIRKYHFGGNACIFPQPFLTVPTPAQWQALIDQIMNLHQAHGFDLAVIDSLAPFLRCENNARSLHDALLPLRTLTRSGMGLVLIHHPGKAARPLGLSARGSSALIPHVDISIEMRQPPGNPLAPRRRRLNALSRYPETPRQLLIELNDDATDYCVCDEAEDVFQNYLAAFRIVLEDAPQKLTRADILDLWPADFDKPADSTLKAWLRSAVEAKMILVEGKGRGRDPYRYWLPDTEERWRQQHPLYESLQQQAKELDLPFESWRERKKKLEAYEKLDLAPAIGDES